MDNKVRVRTGGVPKNKGRLARGANPAQENITTVHEGAPHTYHRSSAMEHGRRAMRSPHDTSAQLLEGANTIKVSMRRQERKCRGLYTVPDVHGPRPAREEKSAVIYTRTYVQRVKRPNLPLSLITVFTSSAAD